MFPPPSRQFSSFLVCGESRIAKSVMHLCYNNLLTLPQTAQSATSQQAADSSFQYAHHTLPPSPLNSHLLLLGLPLPHSENFPPYIIHFFDIKAHFRADRIVCSTYWLWLQHWQLPGAQTLVSSSVWNAVSWQDHHDLSRNLELKYKMHIVRVSFYLEFFM